MKGLNMDYISYPHRFANAIINSDKILLNRYNEFVNTISSISDIDLIQDFIQRKNLHRQRRTSFKSLTPSINSLLKTRITNIPGWFSEVDIFNDITGTLGNTEWRLDFACDNALCVEIAFNHGEAIAWNLLKPVLACELNHVQKAIQGKVGIYVCATDNLKKAGNIDSASGSFEKVLRYLLPMMNQLTIPIMIIGLEAPKNFTINKNANIECHNFIPNMTNVYVNLRLRNNQVVSGVIVNYMPANQLQSVSVSIQIPQNTQPITIYEMDILSIEYQI